MNPEIAVNEEPEVGKESPYEPNWYCPANFVEQTDFFFMPPKAQEYASIRWAIYKDGAFYLPKRTEKANQYDLSGAVTARMDLYDNQEPLFNNTVYELTAIVKRIPHSNNTPLRVGETEPKVTDVSDAYEIYPITAITNVIITGIEELTPNNHEEGLYFNMLGQPVTHPSSGIYIHNGKKVVVK